MNRALLALSTTLAAFSLSGCLGEPDRIETFDYTDAIVHLDIASGAGDIEVHADPDALETSVEARVYGDATEVVAALDGESLTLRHRCPKRHRRCAVDWIVVLPPAEVERIFEANSGAGDIDFFDTSGVLVVDTGAGDIGLHDVHASDVDLETGSGDIGARIVGGMASVRAKSGAGDISLKIPAGAYQVDIDTGAGDVSTRGISNDATAERSVSIETGAGDVTLRGQ